MSHRYLFKLRFRFYCDSQLSSHLNMGACPQVCSVRHAHRLLALQFDTFSDARLAMQQRMEAASASWELSSSTSRGVEHSCGVAGCGVKVQVLPVEDTGEAMAPNAKYALLACLNHSHSR